MLYFIRIIYNYKSYFFKSLNLVKFLRFIFYLAYPYQIKGYKKRLKPADSATQPDQSFHSTKTNGIVQKNDLLNRGCHSLSVAN